MGWSDRMSEWRYLIKRVGWVDQEKMGAVVNQLWDILQLLYFLKLDDFSDPLRLAKLIYLAMYESLTCLSAEYPHL